MVSVCVRARLWPAGCSGRRRRARLYLKLGNYLVVLVSRLASATPSRKWAGASRVDAARARLSPAGCGPSASARTHTHRGSRAAPLRNTCARRRARGVTVLRFGPHARGSGAALRGPECARGRRCRGPSGRPLALRLPAGRLLMCVRACACVCARVMHTTVAQPLTSADFLFLLLLRWPSAHTHARWAGRRLLWERACAQRRRHTTPTTTNWLAEGPASSPARSRPPFLSATIGPPLARPDLKSDSRPWGCI